MELVGVTWRGHLGTAVNYFWTVGYMALAGVAYGLRDWSTLQLVISASSAILLLSALYDSRCTNPISLTSVTRALQECRCRER